MDEITSSWYCKAVLFSVTKRAHQGIIQVRALPEHLEIGKGSPCCTMRSDTYRVIANRKPGTANVVLSNLKP